MVALETRAILLAAIYCGFVGCSPKINLDIDQVLGAVTAEETAKLLGAKGAVLVIARDTGPDKIPSVEAELRSFAQALGKYRDVTFQTLRVPISPSQMMSTGGGLPEQELVNALRTHPNVNALVLFMAFPSLADREVEAIKTTAVKTVVVSSLRPEYKRLLDLGVLYLAIVPRSDAPPANTPPPRSLRERFDQEFEIVRRPQP